MMNDEQLDYSSCDLKNVITTFFINMHWSRQQSGHRNQAIDYHQSNKVCSTFMFSDIWWQGIAWFPCSDYCLDLCLGIQKTVVKSRDSNYDFYVCALFWREWLSSTGKNQSKNDSSPGSSTDDAKSNALHNTHSNSNGNGHTCSKTDEEKSTRKVMDCSSKNMACGYIGRHCRLLL